MCSLPTIESCAAVDVFVPDHEKRQKLCLMLSIGGRVFLCSLPTGTVFFRRCTLKAKIGEVFSAYGANLRKNETFFSGLRGYQRVLCRRNNIITI